MKYYLIDVGNVRWVLCIVCEVEVIAVKSTSIYTKLSVTVRKYITRDSGDREQETFFTITNGGECAKVAVWFNTLKDSRQQKTIQLRIKLTLHGRLTGDLSTPGEVCPIVKVDARRFEHNAVLTEILQRTPIPEGWRHKLVDGNAIDSHLWVHWFSYVFCLCCIDCRQIECAINLLKHNNPVLVLKVFV